MNMPKRPDEVTFYNALRANAHFKNRNQPGREAIEMYAQLLNIPVNRQRYLLDKWTDKGWWDWGVHQWGGWFTRDAPERIE